MGELKRGVDIRFVSTASDSDYRVASRDWQTVTIYSTSAAKTQIYKFSVSRWHRCASCRTTHSHQTTSPQCHDTLVLTRSLTSCTRLCICFASIDIILEFFALLVARLGPRTAKSRRQSSHLLAAEEFNCATNNFVCRRELEGSENTRQACSKRLWAQRFIAVSAFQLVALSGVGGAPIMPYVTSLNWFWSWNIINTINAGLDWAHILFFWRPLSRSRLWRSLLHVCLRTSRWGRCEEDEECHADKVMSTSAFFDKQKIPLHMRL